MGCGKKKELNSYTKNKEVESHNKLPKKAVPCLTFRGRERLDKSSLMTYSTLNTFKLINTLKIH